MPDRWFVPINGVEPRRARLEHVHAAFSRWFDRSPAEHAANDKPYTLSPLTRDETGVVGIEIATLTAVAERRLHESATTTATVRLGDQVRPVSPPRRLVGQSWEQLACCAMDDRWRLEFVTPTTFRCGNRSSPLPRTDTIMEGLRRVWDTWSDTELPKPASTAGADVPSHGDGWGAVWVSDVDLHSVTVSMRIRGPAGRPSTLTLSGALGSLTLRCDDPRAAAHAGPLVRLAAYCGTGGLTGKGLGVTRVQAHRRPDPHLPSDPPAPVVLTGVHHHASPR